ncbi:MAG: phenylacetate--CoA ligase, partial [Bacteroidota bacterium]
MFYSDIETWSLDRLRSLQSQRLRDLVQRLHQQVPFYQKRFAKYGIHPTDIKGIDDLHRLPFTRKNDLRDHYPFGLFASPMEEVRR